MDRLITGGKRMAVAHSEMDVWLLRLNTIERGFGFVSDGKREVFFHIKTLRKSHPEIADLIDPQTRHGSPPPYIRGLRAKISDSDRGESVEVFYDRNESKHFLCAYERDQNGFNFHVKPQEKNYVFEYRQWEGQGSRSSGLVIYRGYPVTLLSTDRYSRVEEKWLLFPYREYSGESLSTFENADSWNSDMGLLYLTKVISHSVACLPCVAIDIESDGEEIYEIGVAQGGESRLIYSHDAGNLQDAIQELNDLVKDKLVVGHNILNWDVRILTKHGATFEDSEFWDTLEASLYISPLKTTHALGGAHRADEDAKQSLKLFRHQAIVWVTTAIGLPEDKVPKTLKRVKDEISHLNPLLALFTPERWIGVYNASMKTAPLKQLDALEQVANRVKERLQETTNVVIALPRQLTDVAKLVPGSTVIVPETVFKAQSRRDVGIALCPDLIEHERDNVEFYLLAQRYFQEIQKANLSPDRALIPPLLRERLSKHEQAWERTKKRCVDCQNLQCAFYPKGVRFTVYEALCEPAFWDYVRQAEVQRVYILYHYLLPPVICERAEHILDKISQGQHLQMQVLFALEEGKIHLGKNVLSSLLLDEDHSRVAEKTDILKDACWLEYTAYDGYQLIVDVSCLHAPRTVETANIVFSADEFDASVKVTALQPVLPDFPENESHSGNADSDEPLFDVMVAMNITSRFRADFWTTQVAMLSEFAKEIQNPLIILVPAKELPQIAELVKDAGLKVIPTYLSLSRQLEILEDSSIILYGYTSAYDVLNKLFELMILNTLPQNTVLIMPEAPMYYMGSESNSKVLDVEGASESRSYESDTEADEELNEDSDTAQALVFQSSYVQSAKEAANCILQLGSAAQRHCGARLIVSDLRLSSLNEIGVTHIQNKRIGLRKDQLRVLHQKAAALFPWSPLLREELGDLEQRLDMWKEFLLPPGADYTPEQKTYLRQVLGKENLVEVSIPTGGGKSVIFQVPALDEGFRTRRLTVVVAPLKALIEDQIARLHQLGLLTCVEGITGDLTQIEINDIFRRVAGGEIILLYVTPERVQTRRFQRYVQHRLLRDRSIAYWILDEAHCVSQWGLDFRPTYMRAAKWIQRTRHSFRHVALERTPVVLLSATLTQSIRQQLQRIFSGADSEEVTTP
jgi:hypothetical protein